MPGIQTERPIEVTSPLGEDVLLLRRMTATEHLGRMFEFELDLFSEDHEIKLEDVLAQQLTVRLNLPEDEKRYFNGYVSRFSQVGPSGKYMTYHATLRPWLWFLTRTADCRIFQDKTVPEILEEIFGEHGFTDFKNSLDESYRTWTYCVQYRETDFNFVSRLMEQEGIYYYFTHEDGKHTLVLSDSYSSHEKTPGYESVPFFAPDDADTPDLDHIYSWSIVQEIQPGTYALNEYDLERPTADLQVKSTVSRNHPMSEFEIYDYPGEYSDPGAKADTYDDRKVVDWGQAYAKARIEELHAQYERVRGGGNARGLCAGGLFELTDYPRDDQNREYLILSATHELESDDYESAGAAGGEEGPTYTCTLTAIDSKQPYRPTQVTPKPVIQGPQTAVVVGKSDEEIWTDKYGRIKVQFPWDRYGESDENSSCWVRVAQVWAGKTWGGIQLPRIGQEVIVEFLEGDPDRPIITGRVYNADCMPPYTLPDNQTQSGIKSRSSKEGSGENFNEIRFEDKKDEEQLFIHAEKNQDIEVENDETHWVGNDREKKVDNDEETTIGHDRSESVGNDESVSVTNDKTIDVGNNHNETIGNDMNLEVANDRSETVKGNHTEAVTKDWALDVEGAGSFTVKKDHAESISKSLGLTVGKDYSIAVEKATTLDTGDSLTITCGQASLILKKDGTVEIKGGKINITASGDLKLKGSKIAEN